VVVDQDPSREGDPHTQQDPAEKVVTQSLQTEQRQTDGEGRRKDEEEEESCSIHVDLLSGESASTADPARIPPISGIASPRPRA
jgi:hypothetical protein